LSWASYLGRAGGGFQRESVGALFCYFGYYYLISDTYRHNRKQYISVKQKIGYISVFRRSTATEILMSDDPASSTTAAGVRAKRRARREKKVALRERYFDLMISGYNCSQIARMVQTSAATVRREVDRALAERGWTRPSISRACRSLGS
jgi:hypothetical protein